MTEQSKKNSLSVEREIQALFDSTDDETSPKLQAEQTSAAYRKVDDRRLARDLTLGMDGNELRSQFNAIHRVSSETNNFQSENAAVPIHKTLSFADDSEGKYKEPANDENPSIHPTLTDPLHDSANQQQQQNVDPSLEDYSRKISRNDPTKGRKKSVFGSNIMSSSKQTEPETNRNRTNSNLGDKEFIGRLKNMPNSIKMPEFEKVKETLRGLRMARHDGSSGESDEGEHEDSQNQGGSRLRMPHLPSIIHGSKLREGSGGTQADKLRPSMGLRKFTQFSSMRSLNKPSTQKDDSDFVLINTVNGDIEMLETMPFLVPDSIAQHISDSQRRITSVTEEVNKLKDVHVAVTMQGESIDQLYILIERSINHIETINQNQKKSSKELLDQFEPSVKTISKLTSDLNDTNAKYMTGVNERFQKIQTQLNNLHDHLQTVNLQGNPVVNSILMILSPVVAVIMFLVTYVVMFFDFAKRKTSMLRSPSSGNIVESNRVALKGISSDEESEVFEDAVESRQEESTPQSSARARFTQLGNRSIPPISRKGNAAMGDSVFTMYKSMRGDSTDETSDDPDD